MKNTVKILLVLSIVVISSCSSFLGVTGPEAYESMNADEKHFVDTVLLTIKKDTSVAELEKLLGPVRKQVFNKMYDWRVSGEDTEYGVRIYFVDNEIFKIRFMRVGKFIWEKELT